MNPVHNSHKIIVMKDSKQKFHKKMHAFIIERRMVLCELCTG